MPSGLFLRCAIIALFVSESVFADVSALGRIEPKDGVINITAPIVLEAGNGIVLGELHVKAGDIVEENQLLATTESFGVLKALKKEAEVAHKLAKTDALAAQALADADCVKAEVKRSEAERRKSLLKQNLSSREESERADADAEFQEASCQASQTVAAASRAKIDVAISHVELRETMLQRAHVYSPSSGKVLNIITWPGEAIGPQGILEFGKTNQMYAIAEVYETDITQVAVGQQATITTDVLPNPLKGTVAMIRPLIRKQDVMNTDPAARKDARIIEVEIKLDNPEQVDDFTNLQVEVVIAQ